METEHSGRKQCEGWTVTQALKYLIRNIKTWMETYFLMIWLLSRLTFPGEYSAVRTVGVYIRRGETEWGIWGVAILTNSNLLFVRDKIICCMR
jgi:hypothetical protein